MNKLPTERRAQILGMMAEGVSIRAICRLTGVSKNTVVKLLRDAGEAFSAYQDEHLRNLRCKRLQLDEIWAFVYAKAKNAPTAKAASEQAGDIWTWVAIDADTKLVASYYVGNRDTYAASIFVSDLAGRLASRAQITSDGLRLYVAAVEQAFGADVDFAQLVKLYGDAPEAQKRYSPAECVGCKRAAVIRQSRSSARLDQIRRAAKSVDADGQPPLHPPNERLFQEGREPRSRDGRLLHALQLRAHSPDASRHARHGGRRHLPAVGVERSRCGSGEMGR